MPRHILLPVIPEETIFKGADLCITSILSDPATNFGEYALGRELKRELILKEFE